MRLKNISLRTKVTTGFVTMLILFVIGLGICIANINQISGFMHLSSKINLIVKDIFHIREIEKDFFRQKELSLLKPMDQSVGLLIEKMEELSLITNNAHILTGLQEIENLITGYHKEFQQTVKYTNEIDQLKIKMKNASDLIFSTFETEIRNLILDEQNSALVTGEEINAAFEEIIKVVDTLMLDLKDAWAYEKSFYLYNDPKYISLFNEKLEAWSQIKSDLDFLIKTSENEKFLAAYEIIDKQFELYNSETMNAIFSLYQMNDEISNNTQNIGKTILGKVQLLQEKAQDIMIQSKNFTIKLAFILLLSGFLFGLGATYFIVTSITKPITKTVAAIQKMAKGDFNFNFDVDQKDEIGMLAKAMQKMMLALKSKAEIVDIVSQGDFSVDVTLASEKDLLGKSLQIMVNNLNELLNQIAQGSMNLGSASEQLSTISNEISSATVQMSTQASTVAGASNQMSSKIASNADSSEKMKTNIQSISATSTEMSQSMTGISQTMEELSMSIKNVSIKSKDASNITDQAKSMSSSATSKMNELMDSAHKIGKITDVIKDIAQQTNLLALNANIEAASAGEAGKGFAVVANEIKELAKQSAASAEAIAKTVADIQEKSKVSESSLQDISTIVESISQSSKDIESIAANGSESVEMVVLNVKESAQGINEIANLVNEISLAAKDTAEISGELKNGSSEINKNMMELSTVVNQTSEGINQVNEQAKGLFKLADQQRKMAGKFKLNIVS